MYDRIGEKLVNLAAGICVVGIVSSVICGVVVMFGEEEFLTGLLILVLGSLASWLGTLALAGFGTLIVEIQYQTEQNRTIIQLLQQQLMHAEPSAPEQAAAAAPKPRPAAPRTGAAVARDWKCPDCGTINPISNAQCKNCGTSRY